MKWEAHQGHKPKGFFDAAIFICYDITNMPYLIFYNLIMNLMARVLIRKENYLFCERHAYRQQGRLFIAIVISDTLDFEDETIISMGLSRLFCVICVVFEVSCCMVAMVAIYASTNNNETR